MILCEIHDGMLSMIGEGAAAAATAGEKSSDMMPRVGSLSVMAGGEASSNSRIE